MQRESEFGQPPVLVLAKKLGDAHVRFVSPNIVTMPKEKAGFSKGAPVVDLDGHCVLLIQR